MIGQSYDEKKKAVLDICRRYLRLRGDTDDGVDADFLEDRMKDLESSRYVLAVVGEAKAGKSTFINALLGESILPTDILQSSSAVVEIFKSKEKYVEVEYADGTTKRFEDDPDTPDLDEAAEQLREIGAIRDRYRAIPATLIDVYILEGRITPGRPLPIPALEAASNKPIQNNEALIREYVQGRTPSDIPRKITFGFPLKYAFEGLRLVDTPGVNAVGGVQDATYEYINEANAVLFVHSLDYPIESESLYDFVNNVLPNRKLETLFLVLTKSGLKSQGAIDQQVSEAYRQYGKSFNHDRILHVDSMLKIVSEEIEQFDRAASLKEHYRERKSQELYQLKLNLLNKVLEDVGGDSDLEVIQAALRKSSNFDEMERIINDFSDRAPELQFSEVLESVKKGFDARKRDLDENISVLEKKRKHPQIFEREISKIQRHLEDYRLSLQKHAENVKKQYTGRHASYSGSLDEITIQAQNEIDSASARPRVRKAISDYYDEMTSFADTVVAAIRADFEDEMKRLGDEFKSMHDISVPMVDVGGIEAKTKKVARRTVEVERSPSGFWENLLNIVTLGFARFTEEKAETDEVAHLKQFKSAIRTVVYDTKNKFMDLVRNLIDRIASDFGSALKARIDARDKELEAIKTTKEANEAIQEKIVETKKRREEITEPQARVSDMLANLP